MARFSAGLTCACAALALSASAAAAQDLGCAGRLDAATSTGQELLACLVEMQREIVRLRGELDRRPAADQWVAKVAEELVANHAERLPRGEDGLAGPAGPAGPQGETGPAGTAATAAAIPAGAVVAFDGFSGCPEGWEIYTPATARVIVGAGSEFHPKHEDWMAELPSGGVRPTKLKPYAAMSSGGEVEHALTVPEMPSHDHGGIWGGNEKKAGMLNDNAFHSQGHVKISSQGEGKPHNNMPPYIALSFCMKK